MLGKITGRIRQGLRALTAWARPVDYELAEKYLSKPLMILFHRMRRSEQQHSLNVLNTIRGWGHDHPSLMIAALLHDVGKTYAPFYLPERVLVVLTHSIMPRRTWRWGKGEPKGWRRPFVITVQHPYWSAEMLRGAGADPLSVELVERHQRRMKHEPKTEAEKLLAILQAADKLN